MESSPDIRVESLNKTYGIRRKIRALNGVTFAVDHGTCTAFVGPNGAGKTTLLKIVAGIIGRYQGRISVNGRISLSPETSVNFPFMDATENVQYFSRIAGNRVTPQAILEEVNLVPKGQLAYSFSKGMKRKLDIARALSLGTEIILMDEPFDGLDPGASRDLSQAINSLKKRGITFLISSHDLLRLNDIADRVVFLNHGKVVGRREMSSGSRLVVKIGGDLSPAIGVIREIGCKIISTEHDEIHFEPDTSLEGWDILGRLINKGIKVTRLSEETLDSDYRRIFLGNMD